MPDETDRKKSGIEDGLQWWVRYGCVPIIVAIIAGIAAITVAVLARLIPQALPDPLPGSTRAPPAVVTPGSTDTVGVTSNDAPVPPTIRLSPPEGGPGTLITVAGEGWGSADTVFVGLSDPSDGQASQVNPAAVGVAATVADTRDFIAAFTFPPDARWVGLPLVHVIAQSLTTRQTAVADFRVVLAPMPTPTPSPTPCAPRFDWPIYIIQPGDSLFQIALGVGATLDQLRQANCLVDDGLVVGQPLRVPRLPPTATPTSTPSPTATATPTPTNTPTPTPTHSETPASPPDLVVSDIDMNTLTVDCPKGGGSCVTTVRFTVANIGGEDARALNIRAVLDPSQLVMVDIRGADLPAQKSQPFSITTLPGGNCYDPDCTVCVIVDSDNIILESNEGNNTLCETTIG